MNAEKWKKVAELYEATLEQPEEKQAAFLSQACGEDEDLRREVLEMLKARKDAGSFLGQPAAEHTYRPQQNNKTDPPPFAS